MNAKWQQVLRTAKALPYIEFDAVLDNHTTALCRSLNGVTVRYDHPYVKIYWPPNHFGCRLTTRQHAAATPTPDDQLPYPVIPDMFRTNLAEGGLIFPKGHPYFRGIPPHLLSDKSTGFVDPDFVESYQLGKSGRLRVHELTDINKRQQHIRLGKSLAAKNYKVDLMPEIDKANKEARQLFFPELKTNSNPDARINGALVDFKIPDAVYVGNTSIRNAVKSCTKKGVEICVIDLSEKQYRVQEILSTLKGAFKPQTNTTVNEVWLMLNENNLIRIPKEMVRNKDYYKIWKAF